MLITFSGLDGAGKSTLISYLKEELAKRGRESTVLTMYDHVGLYATVRRVRDTFRRVLGPSLGEKMSTDPDRLGGRKNADGLALLVVRSPLVKQIAHVFDLLLLIGCRIYTELILGRVLILDRYFYDSLADIAGGPSSWIYIRWFLRFTPRPRVPLFIDVAPEIAFGRKQEYSVEYLRRRRDTYLRIFQLARHPVVVLENSDLEQTRRQLIALIADIAARK